MFQQRRGKQTTMEAILRHSRAGCCKHLRIGKGTRSLRLGAAGERHLPHAQVTQHPPALAGVTPSKCVSISMLLLSARQASAADRALCTPTLASLWWQSRGRAGVEGWGRTARRRANASSGAAHWTSQYKAQESQPPAAVLPTATHLWMTWR